MKTKLIGKYYIDWSKESFDPETSIVEAIYAIKGQGHTPVKIYADKITRSNILHKLVTSTGKLPEPGMSLKEFYGLPVVRSKQLYILFK